MSNITKRFSSAKTVGQGNYFLPGRGEVFIQDVVVKDTFKEPHRFILELYTVKSSPDRFAPDLSPLEPNAPGSSWAVQEPLTTRSGALDRAKGLIAMMLGKGNLSDDELTKEFERICRLDEDGHTDPNLGPCPLRGVRLAYSTLEKEIKGGPNAGKTMTLPKLSLIRETPDQIAANLSAMNGE